MRYANITSIHSSYIVAFFSSLGTRRPQVRTRPQLGRQIADYIFHKNDFMFHISFLCFNLLIINYLEK